MKNLLVKVFKQKKKSLNIPEILLINPWIHDFAAYDFWAKPLGLLSLASLVKIHGAHVTYIDCLDRHHKLSKINNNFLYTGPYLKRHITKPKELKDIPRNYSRYGIPPDWLEYDLKRINPPDLIMVSSMMTYWYPGTEETIRIIKNIYPATPIVLGGIYPSICKEHALKKSSADYILTGPGESVIMPMLSKILGWSPSLKFNYSNIETYPKPSFELQTKLFYVPILTTRGCPCNCTYCASNFLHPKMRRRSLKSVVNEIFYWYKIFKITEFVFYDDALLLDSKNHAIPIFESIIRSGIKVNFHTPNAVHIREISNRVAKLMYRVGFKTIRLGLETTNFQNRHYVDTKLTYDDFKKATRYLAEAGFISNQIGVYLLVGLPDQDINEVKQSIYIVKKANLKPILAHYSPIPHTAMWHRAAASSRYDLRSDPIFTNNAISPCSDTPFSWKNLSELKAMI